MVIAVTSNTEYLREELEGIGYTVVILGEYNYPIDAMIYLRHIPDSSYISMNNMPINQSENNSYGILMVSAFNKSTEEIESILRTRLYSPLF